MISPFLSVFILVVFLASFALADDFKTINGKEFKNAKVSRVEPDGIVLITTSGIVKVYFVELPKDVQERFHYDPTKAAQFTTAGQAAIAQSNAAAQAAALQRQQEAQERQRQIASAIEQQQPQEAVARRQAEQQQQVERQRAAKSTPSLSKEGVPEHTYELVQDYTIVGAGWSKRLRRGERDHGRILIDHAEIDIGGFSYNVPSGILSLPKD